MKLNRKQLRKMILQEMSLPMGDAASGFNFNQRNSDNNLVHMYFDIELIREKFEEFQSRWYSENPDLTGDDFETEFYVIYDYKDALSEKLSEVESQLGDFDYYTPPETYDEPDEYQIANLIDEVLGYVEFGDLRPRPDEAKREVAAAALGLEYLGD